jgi:hypothetical protein
MLDVLREKFWMIFLGSSAFGLLALGLYFSPKDSNTVPEEPLPFSLVSNDELLDQIFEEEKSDRIIRFIRNRKMKA